MLARAADPPTLSADPRPDADVTNADGVGADAPAGARVTGLTWGRPNVTALDHSGVRGWRAAWAAPACAGVAGAPRPALLLLAGWLLLTAAPLARADRKSVV